MAVVVVRICVFALFSWTPSGAPSSSKRARNHGKSSCGRQMDVSSIMEAVCACPPLPSSCASPAFFRRRARWSCSLLICMVTVRRTRQENNGLSGHPCGKPSSWRSLSASPLSLKNQEGVCVCVKRSYRGRRGVVSTREASIRRASVRDVLLNMLWRSRHTKALVGVWGSSMYFATSLVVVCATKSIPPGIWIPYWPPLSKSGVIWSVMCVRAILAATRRKPVPMPMGLRRWSLFGSLWRARK